ncbi:DEAD/DEAH box helicase [Chryseobacterium sp. Ch-15]|uniref:DEAD/DEAH box helicase n=1 Tax=Chryseobacterium muglaense TaxID=2893752 RepID=A0A9Q3UUG0_9FLAO|nr:DEAD/DEAH box helicase [Chryseobacterium muglaense]MBD3903031.1 DEAD/DEAH box helicase [Chryseobacterium muglaense]MCC9035863.1 DEAD/DEAH box helicase [Chryseobacterium muglaense]MCM2554408.1 DEAD/DEAH box helicase [Chryseobacterium muglaense]
MSKIQTKEKKQLSSLKNNEIFNECLKKITLSQKLDYEEITFILSAAIIFFRYYNHDKRYKGYFNIGYYIILKYSIIHKDYKPLYDISLQIGFYPISNFIISNDYVTESYVNERIINKTIYEKYKKETYIETIEQSNRSLEIFENIKEHDSAYIAPTSYGKSSIIKDVIIKNNYNKIGIIVPTKSLLMQTYNDMRKLNLNYKLILHDEMYNGEEKFIGILTQERANRLINKMGLSFDILFIDEAHNLLKNDARNLLLSRFIMLNHKSNNDQRLLYLSPLISDSSQLKIKNTSEGTIHASTINHNMKIFDVYYLDKKGKLKKYNRFTDDYYNLKIEFEFEEYIIKKSKNKNFIYNYRPKFVERIANKIYGKIDSLGNSEELNKIARVISEEINEDLDLIALVKKGVLYLHGKLPNILKEYLENAFKEIEEFKYLVANSVILEGVNFPIDNLYITSTFGLSSKDLNNLIGRVNRLNYVFSNSLTRLISKIHFVDSDEFTDSRSLMGNKIKLLREHVFIDENKNPLLENYDVGNLKLSNKEKDKKKIKDSAIIDSTNFLLQVHPENLEDRITHYFIENNIDDFYKDISTVVQSLVRNIDNLTEDISLLDLIYEVFIENNELYITDYELERLKNLQARKYYQNYIDTFQLLGLKEKIINTVNYFETKVSSNNDSFLFIGSSFGEEIKMSKKYNNPEYLNKVYINLKEKSRQELSNISLIKIKLEEDFVSFKLKKLITFLYDFHLINISTYYKAVYGSDDSEIIDLTRIGLNPNVIRILKNNNQIENISFDANGNLISNENFMEFLKHQPELFKFEINKYISEE